MQGNRAFGQETYDALVEAFREKPNNIKNAAKVAGVSWDTAKRAWSRGWVRRGWLPIMDFLAKEKMLARAGIDEAEYAAQRLTSSAEQARRAQEERDQAAADALEARKLEGRAAKLARSNAVTLLAAMAKLTPGVNALSNRLAEQIGASDANFSPEQAANLISSISLSAKRISECARIAIVLERLYLGEPTEVLEVREGAAKTLTLEEIEHHAQRAQETLRRLRRKGLEVLTGGRSENLPATVSKIADHFRPAAGESPDVIDAECVESPIDGSQPDEQ